MSRPADPEGITRLEQDSFSTVLQQAESLIFEGDV